MSHKKLKRKLLASNEDFGHNSFHKESVDIKPEFMTTEGKKGRKQLIQTSVQKDPNDNDLDFDVKTSVNTSEDIAKRLMTKMGYKEGQGLGKDSQGRAEPIEQTKQKGRRGLGFALNKIFVNPVFEWTQEKEREFVSVVEEVKWMDECGQQIPTVEELDDFYTIGPKVKSLEKSETNFCDSIVLENVINCKTVLDSMSDEELRRSRSTANPFENIERGMFQNRAAMKMANIDAVFDYMFTEPTDELNQPLVKPSQLLYFADICAGPGGFSEYVLWRKKWMAKGFGFTLKGANDFKLDEFFAGRPETFEPHYGSGGLNGTGDIYNPNNLIEFRKFVLANSEGGVHFVMADGGFSVEGQENDQEILSKRLYLCQMLCALAILRTNGCFVCKLFDVFTPFSVGLVYLMYRVFKRVCIHKPNTSRPANSERYLICKWKRSETSPIETYLFKLNCHLQHNEEDITELVPLNVLKADQKFSEYMTESNNSIGKRQILFLSKVKTFADNPQLDLQQSDVRKECLKYWNLEVKSRTAPPRPDPSLKFRELTSNAIQTNNFFAFKPKILEMDNLKDLEYIHGFQCMVLCAENDSNTCSANSFASVRGFFMGLGRTNIYYWSGSALSKWTKLEAKFELSPETIVFGEYIKELKGEGKAQRRIDSFHIIDPLFIGGIDVRNESFDKRISMANMFAKAVNKSTQTEYASVRMKRVFKLSNIDEIFKRIQWKECKSGAQKSRLCYEIDVDDRFVIPNGLLIINTIKEPLIMKFSQNKNRMYCFDLKSGVSSFDIPTDSLADFQYSFSNRIFWKWDSEQHLMSRPIDSSFKLSRFAFKEFIDKRK